MSTPTLSAPAERSLATRAIHGAFGPDPSTGAILTPIHQTTTFVQEAVGVHKGYTYTRSGNPTVAALEKALGTLENAQSAVAFSTGMSAISALCLGILEHGDRVLVSDVVYGGTVRLLRTVLGRFGVDARFVDTARIDELERALAWRPKLLLIESPANPTLKLTDLSAASDVAHAAGALVAVDNTFLTPALQTPLDLGADFAVYSTTKYLEGHNATVGGAVVARDPELLAKLRFVQNAVGIAQSPFEAWLTLRGLKTLPLRMAQHSANALAVATFLEGHPGVWSVRHPWLASFPQGELARRQQSDGGGMIAFELRGGSDVARRFLAELSLCSLAENLGAVETLVTHPASMTHGEVPAAERAALGIGDGLVRLSVGLEEPADIVADIERALDAAEA